jgi:hypothetical protein
MVIVVVQELQNSLEALTGVGSKRGSSETDELLFYCMENNIIPLHALPTCFVPMAYS